MKRILSLALTAALLLALLAGCGNTPATTDPTPSGTQTDATDAAPAETPSDTADDTPDAPADETDPAGPLFAEPKTFTGWISVDITMDPNAKLNDLPGWQWIEEKTNVTMDWDMISSAAATEQFNLMIVSGNYNDIIVGGSYTGGFQYYLDEEILVDLAPYITGGYAPNYEALRQADEDLRKDSMLDSGSMAVFYRILSSVQQSWLGLYADRGLAEANGINVDELETLDDFHDLLAIYRDNGMDIPYAMTNNGWDGPLMSAFGISGSGWLSPFITVDGKIEYSFITDEYYDYLSTMHQWYDEGLFESEFHGRTTAAAWDNQLLATGTVGMLSTLATSADMINVLSGLDYRAIKSPVRKAGDIRNVAQVGSCTSRVEGPFTSVTTSCQDVESVIRYLDFFYSDEAYLHNNYGIEGESYELDESGNPHYTQAFWDNTDYNFIAKLQYYAGYNTFSCLNYWENQKDGQPESVLYAYNLWDADYEDTRTLPPLSLTAEESETHTSYYTDIATYASEMVLKFITGIEPLTRESYDAYVKHIRDMGIDHCLEIYQTAYERYLER